MEKEGARQRGVGWEKREGWGGARGRLTPAGGGGLQGQVSKKRDSGTQTEKEKGTKTEKGVGGATHQQQEEEEGHKDESSEGHGHWHRRSLLRFPEHVLHKQRTTTLNKPFHTEEHAQTTMSLVTLPVEANQTHSEGLASHEFKITVKKSFKSVNIKHKNRARYAVHN